MKGKVRRVTEEFIDRDRDLNESPRVQFDPSEESFSQFRAKFGTDGVTVKIYRRTPQGLQYCFLGAPSEIDEEVIRLYHSRQAYAAEAGQYLARPFVNGEPRDGFSIQIGPQTATPVTSGAAGAFEQNGMAEIARLLSATIERLELRLLQSHEREPLSSLADTLVKLNGLQQQSRPELPIEQLVKAIELGRSLAGTDGSEWKGLIAELLREGVPLLRDALSTSRRSEIGGGVMSGQQRLSLEEGLLKEALNWLKQKCLAGSDPGLYVEVVLDNASEPQYQRLLHAVLSREFSSFAALDPEIDRPPFAAFFRFLYDGLRSGAQVEDSVAEHPAGKSGDAGDAAGDGGSSAKSVKKS